MIVAMDKWGNVRGKFATLESSQKYCDMLNYNEEGRRHWHPMRKTGYRRYSPIMEPEVMIFDNLKKGDVKNESNTSNKNN